MPRIHFLILAIFLAVPVLAGPLDRYTTPGTYSVIGRLAFNDGEFELIVFDGSLSQTVLKLVLGGVEDRRQTLLASAASLVGRKVSVTGTILEPVEKQRGTIVAEDISYSVPDPLESGGGDGFHRKD